MRCFVHRMEAFGLGRVGSGEPLKALGREHHVIRSTALGKSVLFIAVFSVPRAVAGE